MFFPDRLRNLPSLGLGVSTEYGATSAPGALDLHALLTQAPHLFQFLELGVETAKGFDPAALTHLRSGRPSTYHFLDVNLDEPEDLTQGWLDEVVRLTRLARPAWICGDAGLWHLGPRDRGQMLLLPPLLTDAEARESAEGVRAIREATGLEVLPENPPGTVYIGDLHLLDFFARLLDHGDTGFCLDCAHLAIYQRLVGRRPTDGLMDFPLDRVVELHMAGGAERVFEGLSWVEDTHGPELLPDTLEIFEFLLENAQNLRAVVLECERNPVEAVIPTLETLDRLLRSSSSPLGARP